MSRGPKIPASFTAVTWLILAAAATAQEGAQEAKPPSSPNASSEAASGSADPFTAASERYDRIAHAKLPELLQLVADDDEHVRVEAAYKIIKLQGDKTGEVFDGLLAALGSKEASERRRAAISLGAMCHAAGYRWLPTVAPRVMKELTSRLTDDSPEVRQAAAELLASMVGLDRIPASVFSSLVRALADPHPSLRVAAVKALGRTRDYAIPKIIPLLRDGNAEVRVEAAVALGKLFRWGYISDTEWLADAKACGSVTGDTRAFNWRDWANANYPPAIEGLKKAAADPDRRVRVAAVEALGERCKDDPKPATGVLKIATCDSEEVVRVAAITALGKCCKDDPKPAADVLKAAMQDPEEDVRVAAAEAIGILSKDAVPLLVEALQQDGPSVAEVAARTLGRALAQPGERASRTVYPMDARLSVEGFLTKDDHTSPHRAEPQKPADATTATAVLALAKALADPEKEFNLRSSAAESLLAINSFTDPAVLMIAEVLEDKGSYIRMEALEVLKALGRGAKDQLPAIIKMACRFPENRCGAIEAMVTIGLASDKVKEVVPRLVEFLGDADVDVAQLAAWRLSQIGPPAVGPLTEALTDKNPRRRRSAAFGLALMPKHARGAVPQLAQLLADKDADVAWNSVQALGVLGTEDREIASRLAAMLVHSDAEVRSEAAHSLASFGQKARSTKAALMRAVKEDKDENVRTNALMALQRIGLDATDAMTLSQLPMSDSSRLASEMFSVLAAYPESALAFLRTHPRSPLEADAELLVRLLEDKDPKSAALRDALFESNHVPAEVMAWVGDSRFIPAIMRRGAGVNSYERLFLAACARACGDKPERVVRLSETEHGDFRPASAQGYGDSRRMPADFHGGHGDGYARVLITGRIILKDGHPPINVKPFNTNDRMLLGKRLREGAAIKFDPKTGRFVFFTVVFAAYAGGEGAKEPGPYQTGPATVLIEADGAKPLEVTFFDEMPDVLITLTPSEPVKSGQ